MNISRRQMLILLPAAAVAWESVLAGTPESSPNYKMTDHWCSMLIDISKCIGCGNCVRACQAENDVPDGFFRTWVERYHVTDWHLENPEVISPDGGKEGFPAVKEDDNGKYFFRPQTLQPVCGFAMHPGLSRGSNLYQPGWGRAD